MGDFIPAQAAQLPGVADDLPAPHPLPLLPDNVGEPEENEDEMEDEDEFDDA